MTDDEKRMLNEIHAAVFGAAPGELLRHWAGGSTTSPRRKGPPPT